MNDVFISSNWVVSNGDNRLKKVLTYFSGNKDCNIENISVDNCVCLIRPENANLHSKPEIQIKLKSFMSEINLFSESSLIEVFGKHDEYLFTSVPNFIDDWEGMAVYHAKIILPAISYCKLKFTRVKDQTRFWLYGVELTVDKFKSTETAKPALFNLENVNNLLNNSSQEISVRAEKFKSFFELWAKSSSQSNNNFNARSFNIENLKKILISENNSIPLHVEEIDHSNTMKIQSELTGNNKKTPPEENMFTSDLFNLKKDDISSATESSVAEFLKCYINFKFNEMKQDILEHVDFKLNELRKENNSYLERILKSLETLKST